MKSNLTIFYFILFIGLLVASDVETDIETESQHKNDLCQEDLPYLSVGDFNLTEDNFTRSESFFFHHPQYF